MTSCICTVTSLIDKRLLQIYSVHGQNRNTGGSGTNKRLLGAYEITVYLVPSSSVSLNHQENLAEGFREGVTNCPSNFLYTFRKVQNFHVWPTSSATGKHGLNENALLALSAGSKSPRKLYIQRCEPKLVNSFLVGPQTCGTLLAPGVPHSKGVW